MTGSQQLILAEGAGGAVAANYIEDVFSTWLYTGNNSTQTITNGIDLSTKGGMVWVKDRDATWSHEIFDTARGAPYGLYTNSTSAQVTENDFGSFLTNGFSFDGAGVNNGININGDRYASWTFRKQPKFFDVVTYTGNGTAGRTISHSLGSVPGCIIVKRTDAARDWAVYHRSLGATQGIYLNTADAAFTSLTALWNGTTPTSTVFSVGANPDVNASGGTYVAYLFAHDAGGFGAAGTDNVISCGGYTGTGAAGNAQTLGYEPQWLLVKRSSGTEDWYLFDNMRGLPGGTTGDDSILRANTSGAETQSPLVNITATGFSFPGGGGINASGSTYIYIAIRRGPMKTPTTGTSVYNAVAYTGDGSTTREISTSITPDLAMTKGRSSPYVPFWCSRLAGAPLLYSSSTDAERLASDFTNGGFRINTNSQAGIIMAAGSGGTANNSNANGADFINWNFRRAPGFFDVVCYTGTGSATTQAHNLGVVPELMIVKSRSSGIYDWRAYSSAIGATKYLKPNGDSAEVTSSAVWNDTTPTSSVFTVGSNATVNASGGTYVAYLFASCPGVSKVGSYTGTGSTLQINCGFTGGARFVLIKRTDSTGEWYVWDSARGIVAGNDPYLLLNSAASEESGTDWVDTHSPGFELSNAAGNLVNTNGGTYIFLAIA